MASPPGYDDDDDEFEVDSTLMHDDDGLRVHVSFSQPCTEGAHHFDLTFKVTFPSRAVFNEHLNEHFENMAVGEILREKYDTIDFEGVDYDGLLTVLGVMITNDTVVVDYTMPNDGSETEDEDEDEEEEMDVD